MQPGGNLVVDTICRTAVIGLTFTGAADAGTFTIIDAARSLSRGTSPTAPSPGTCVITLSADWLTCRAWGFPPSCTFVSLDSPAPFNNVGGKSSKPPSTAPMMGSTSPTGFPAGFSSGWPSTG